MGLHVSHIFSLSPAEFSIWTREAGAGGLSIAVEGPSRAEISFDDRKDGSCGVSYIAQEPGRENTPNIHFYPPWLFIYVSLSLWVTFSSSSSSSCRWLWDFSEVQWTAHTRQPLPGSCRRPSERRPPPHCYRSSGEAWGDTSTPSLPCLY